MKNYYWHIFDEMHLGASQKLTLGHGIKMIQQTLNNIGFNIPHNIAKKYYFINFNHICIIAGNCIKYTILSFLLNLPILFLSHQFDPDQSYYSHLNM